jgi:hypothetical protein
LSEKLRIDARCDEEDQRDPDGVEAARGEAAAGEHDRA